MNVRTTNVHVYVCSSCGEEFSALNCKEPAHDCLEHEKVCNKLPPAKFSVGQIVIHNVSDWPGLPQITILEQRQRSMYCTHWEYTGRLTELGTPEDPLSRITYTLPEYKITGVIPPDVFSSIRKIIQAFGDEVANHPRIVKSEVVPESCKDGFLTIQLALDIFTGHSKDGFKQKER